MFALLTFVLASPPPVVPDAICSVEVQWTAISACARSGLGLGTGDAAATAVCIGERDGFAYLLTSAHAAPKGVARDFEFFSKGKYPNSIRSHNRGNQIVRTEDSDIVLLKLPIGSQPVPTLKLAGPGERPKKFPFAALSVGCPDASAPMCREEKVLDKKLVRRPGGGMAFFWQVAVPPVGGMSGGPLLDDKGRVIGICSATQGGVGYFTHLDEILFAIKQSDHAWLLETR